MISFERIEMDNVPWENIESNRDSNVFQTHSWINFLTENQSGEPVITTVKSDGEIIGHFIGLIVKKYGLKILGSPFRGWATYFMGFILKTGACYRDVLQAFPSFVFNDLGCHYFEIIDPCVKDTDFIGLYYKVEALPWYAIDLSPDEEELFARMKSSGRRAIRKSLKSGVSVEVANEDGFAEEYYAQYTDVLEKRSLVPTYSLHTVQRMIDHMQRTEDLLLLRSRDSHQMCVATCIFLAKNKVGVYWGGASWREYQSIRPNEPLFWYAFKALKARGIIEIHMGGEAEQFKEKLGSNKVRIYRLMKARNALLDKLINILLSQSNLRFRNWALRRL